VCPEKYSFEYMDVVLNADNNIFNDDKIQQYSCVYNLCKSLYENKTIIKKTKQLERLLRIGLKIIQLQKYQTIIIP
jgi:hypothetical protein